jgi:hypothetical protein
VLNTASMDFEISSDLSDIIDGLTAFIDAEIVTRHRDNEKMLSDPRQVYDPDGRYSQAMLDLFREVRMTSANAGYYAMFVPEAIGGGGLGFEALFRVWEHIFHRYGAKNSLAAETRPGPCHTGGTGTGSPRLVGRQDQHVLRDVRTRCRLRRFAHVDVSDPRRRPMGNFGQQDLDLQRALRRLRRRVRRHRAARGGH